MILCVNVDSLAIAPHVQKDVALEDILSEHTRYFDSVSDALKCRYAPLNFSTSVRTTYTNKVLKCKQGDKHLYYVNLTNVPKYAHKGYDLLMYLSAVCFMSCVNFSEAVDEMMFKYSAFQPIGLYNPDPELFNPLIYSHVIIADEGIETLSSVLRPENSLETLNHMRQHTDGNILALLDTLVDVKKGDKENAESNYN